MRSSTLLIIFAVAFFIAIQGNAQRLPGLDKSPMDMAYFPPNFAHDRQVDNAVIRVTYSRPQKDLWVRGTGRKVQTTLH